MWSPAFQALTGCSSVSVVWPASGSLAKRRKVGSLAAPCMLILPSASMPLSNLGRIELSIDRLVGDDDFGRDVRGNRLSRGANLERAFVPDHNVRRLQAGGGVGLEAQPPSNIDTTDPGVARDIVEHVLASTDRDSIVCAGHSGGGPRRGIRPDAARDSRRSRIRAQLGDAAGDAVYVAGMSRHRLRE